MDIIDNIVCPVCNQSITLFDYFLHIREQHPLLLNTLASLMMPEMDGEYIINNIYQTDEPEYTYENLTELCDRIGNVKIGVKNIDDISSATIYVESENTNNDDSKCSICLETFNSIQNNSNNYIRKINKCKHKFCNDCISVWLNDHKTCPICKIEIE